MIKDLQKWDADYRDITTHRLLGAQCEQNGELADAIDEYAAAIRRGREADPDLLHAYEQAYRRIIALLDKLQRYTEEIDYINAYLATPLTDEQRRDYEQQRLAAELKLQKQTAHADI